jgi:hypothetical protein
MPLVELSFTHPNTGRQYHSELWELDESTLNELRELVYREDVRQELMDDQALDEDSPTTNLIKSLLSRGHLFHNCEPAASIPVYWRRPIDCTRVDL